MTSSTTKNGTSTAASSSEELPATEEIKRDRRRRQKAESARRCRQRYREDIAEKKSLIRANDSRIRELEEYINSMYLELSVDSSVPVEVLKNLRKLHGVQQQQQSDT